MGRVMVVCLLMALLVILFGVQVCVNKFNQDIGQPVTVMAINQTDNYQWQLEIMNHSTSINAAPLVHWSKHLMVDAGRQWQECLRWAEDAYQGAGDKVLSWWQRALNSDVTEKIKHRLGNDDTGSPIIHD